MKKSVIKNISLPIAGLLGLGVITFGAVSFSEHKKDNINVALAYEGTPLPTSGTLSSGTYYLSSDLTVSSQLKIPSGDVIVNLNGHTLNGGGKDKGIFHVTGGTLTVNGKDDETGNRGALNNGGGYYPGKGYSYGGALYITAGAATLSDLDITNCQSNWGGAIAMSNSAVTLNNCNLSNNMDTNGYGFYGVIRVGDSSAAGTGLTVNGGEMFSNDGAISVGSNAKVTINGAYIHDNEKLGVRVDASEGLKISGNTIIKDNNSSPRNLVLNNNTVKVGIVSELGNDAYIGVTVSGDTKGVFTNSTDTSLNDASKFFSDDPNYAVAKNSDGQLYLTNSIATVTSGETITEYSNFSEAVSAWNSAASGATLSLIKDVTISSTINVSTTKTFDLNGCGINANGGNFPIFTAANGGNLTLNDSGSTTHYYTLADVESNGAAFATICDEATYEAAATDARGTFTGGYLTGANPLVNTGNPYPGGGIYILENGAVTMNGGTIIGNIAPNCAGGVGSYGKFIMNDGNIVYNRSRRGAVLAAAGEMTINGGHISYNTGRGTEYCGTCGVLIYGGCTSFLVNGGYITNNFARYAGFGSNIPTISISGNPVIKDNIGCGSNGTDATEINALLFRRSNLNVYFDVVGELTEGAEIGVSIENITSRSVFTNSSDISYNDESKFFSDNSNYDVVKNNDGQLILSSDVATIKVGSDITYYSSLESALSNWVDGSTLTLLKDVVTSSTITVNNTCTLDLNGYGFRASNTGFSIFNVASSGNLTVNDSNPSHAHEVTLSNYLATGVSDGTGEDNVNNGTGTAYINGGYVAGGYNGMHGGFYVSGGALTLNGGTVIGNKCSDANCAGGGIYVESNGYFTMNGGSIKYNYSGNAGAGIAANHSTIEINGGVISFNRNNWSGGGAMSLDNSSSLKLYGGVIENNVSNHAEGGISFKSANQYLGIKGSPIVRNNTSVESGYAVNLLLYSGMVAQIEGPLTEEADIHLCYIGDDSRVITNDWSTYMGDEEPTKYLFNDNPNFSLYLKDGEAWLLKPCTVTFNTNGIGTAPDPISVGESLLINKPADPTAEGYDFLGWYKESTFDNAWDFATDTVDSDITLYAKWQTQPPTASITKGIDVTYYNNFDDALSHWEDDSTLTLLKDVTMSSAVTISNTRILDLNGYGINTSGISSDTDYAILVNNGGNLTLNDSGDTTHYFTHERYKGYDAGLATICDKTTYDAASEDSRGTFEGGYLTGLSIVKESVSQSGFFKIEENSSFTMNGGTIIGIYADYSSSCVCSNGTFIMNDGNMIYNVNARGCINARRGILTINGGNISHNTDKSSKNSGRTGALWLNNLDNPTYTIRGGTITNNVAIYGAINTQNDIAIEGNPVIKDNIGVGTDENSDAPMNIVLSWGAESKLNFIGEYTGSEPLGVSIYMDDVTDVTNSADVSFNNTNNVVSDNPNYAIGMYPSNHAKAGQLFYIGVGTINVIDSIDNIAPISYNGGKNDSLNDIVAAIDGYNNLTQNEKDFVDGINKDVLDHYALVYKHVDNVGDLIKAIPEASDSQEYYDAVEAALAAYKALTDEEKAILNADLDFQYKKTLDDNIAVKEVIELIQDIGEVTYNGGQNDSKDDIITAEEAYNNLTEDQKNIVDNVNKDVLDDSKDSYDKVDETVKLIESIGNVSHGGESDSKEAIDAAKTAYDSLTPEEKALVDSYNNSEKVLEDDEAVYGAMEAIDAIGDVDYTTESEEAIIHAQEIYDSLSDDQKEQLGDEYINLLIESHNKYETAKKQGDILFLILIIVTSLTLVGGIVFLCFLIKKKRNNNDDQGGDNSKGKPVKAYSFGGLVTSLILIGHYLDTKYIILYVLASLAIVVWIACLIVALTIKREKAIKEEIKPQQVKEIKPQENNEDEEEVETITDEKGNIFQIRFIKSFTAKLIQSPIETKKYYEELKNEVLSYKGAHSRISWHFDSVNVGRNYILKFAIRGKTLCVYLPLDSEKLEDKYKVEKAETKRYEDVPCLYRIKNDRRCGYAKDLIAMVAFNFGLEKGEEQHEVYSNLPYEENKPLIARGLIKELKVKVNKPAEAPVILESKVNSEGDEVVLTKDGSGNLFEIRYVKSFTAKLSQSEAEVKDYYTILKNYVLSYKGVHSRISWHYDAINVSRDYILKFAIRGKSLCVYFALDSSKLDKKYKVEEAKGNRYIEVPCLYRIKNNRRCEYAKELIDLLMKEHGLKQGDIPNEDYHIKKESTKALLAKGLIKEIKHKVQDQKVITHYESITVFKADEVMSDEKAEASIEEVEANKHKEGSKAIINIDTLSEHYNNGDEVTLDTLIEKGLVPSKVGHIKVLARGELNKKLHVVANEYSLQAIKMIILVGGSVKKIK